MKTTMRLSAAVTLGILSAAAFSGDDHPAPAAASGPACEGFGPQTPRDIDNKKGDNPQHFPMAPTYRDMNLCNIHFHASAEHKAKAFALSAGEGEQGHGGGYQCTISKKLSQAELAAPTQEICKGLKPGDTIEVHWVYSSCQVAPGKGLDACLSDKCGNPGLRVESQVFTLVNDKKALNFNNFGYQGGMVKGVHQAKAIPASTGKPVEFLGSTTGPKYSDASCSPLQVTWSVRPQCAKLDINSLGDWCMKNEFSEDHAHGVRKLVINPKLLSQIK